MQASRNRKPALTHHAHPGHGRPGSDLCCKGHSTPSRRAGFSRSTQLTPYRVRRARSRFFERCAQSADQAACGLLKSRPRRTGCSPVRHESAMPGCNPFPLSLRSDPKFWELAKVTVPRRQRNANGIAVRESHKKRRTCPRAAHQLPVTCNSSPDPASQPH
jgi:hypothetical protein